MLFERNAVDICKVTHRDPRCFTFLIWLDSTLPMSLLTLNKHLCVVLHLNLFILQFYMLRATYKQYFRGVCGGGG